MKVIHGSMNEWKSSKKHLYWWEKLDDYPLKSAIILPQNSGFVHCAFKMKKKLSVQELMQLLLKE